MNEPGRGGAPDFRRARWPELAAIALVAAAVAFGVVFFFIGDCSAAR